MRPLYGFQEQAKKALLANETGGALLMEPGLGKTLTAIRAAGTLAPCKVLVVCPVNAVGVWRTELSKEWEETVYTPTGTREQKSKDIGILPVDSRGYLLLNYEALLSPLVMQALEKWNPDLVIVDEAHRMKSPTARRSKAVLALCKNRRAFILTGTPVVQGFLDLYSLYKAIDPAIWDNQNWTQFKQKYAVFGGFGGYEVTDYKNVDELRRRIKPYTYALTKDKALDLPERTDQIVPVYLPPFVWNEYTTLAKTGVLSSRGIVTRTPLEVALRLHQLVGTAKIDATVDLVNDLQNDGQAVVVFYRFIPEGEQLFHHLSKQHKVYHVRGGVSAAARMEMVARFQGSGGVFLGQISAAGTAITLHRSSNVVYYSLTWSHEDHTQSRDRVYRIGQENKVTYRYMTAYSPQGKSTIDTLVLNSLRTKDDLAAQIIKHPELLQEDL